MRYPPPALERFWAKVNKTDDCWLYNETKPKQQQFIVNYKHHMAHRWAWEEAYGPIPGDMQVIRTCRSPMCVRRSHLRLVTPTEAAQFSGAVHARAAQTHCKYGHEFTPENTYRKSNGTRECIKCRQRYSRERVRRRK